MIDPVIVEIGALSIRWYGVVLAIGALAGLLLAVQEGKRFGIKSDFFMDLLLLGAPSAIIAARIYYVAFQWDYYKDNLGDIIKIWNGGIAIYGAIIGALICGFFFSRAKGYSFWRIADICAPSLLIGQMIGRWGNFFNQEAYGGPVEESFLRETLHLPSFIVDQMYIDGRYVHPTFLYESLWSLLGLVVLFVIRRQRFLKAGELLTIYIGWYSIGRFYIEALRTDSLAFSGPQWLADLINSLWAPMTVLFEQGYLDPAYGNIRSSQLLALLLVLAAILFIIVRRTAGLATERYNDPIVSTKQNLAKEERERQSEINDAVRNKQENQVSDADAAAIGSTAVIMNSATSSNQSNQKNNKKQEEQIERKDAMEQSTQEERGEASSDANNAKGSNSADNNNDSGTHDSSETGASSTTSDSSSAGSSVSDSGSSLSGFGGDGGGGGAD